MDALRRFLAQARDYWRGLGTARKVGVVAAAAGALLVLAGFVYFSPDAGYIPVYSDLTTEDAGAMQKVLNAAGIPTKLNTDGTGILVPRDRFPEARVALGVAGLPSRGGKGYELFDENALTMTPFVQQVNYQRALQSELSRSIAAIDPVRAARVLIARPEPTPFVRDQRPPTASVVLTLKPGAVMPRPTAASIVSLVARSVEGLKPENVTVVDSGGRLLSDPHAGERDDLSAPQLLYRQQLEGYLADEAVRLLDKHLGPGRAAVRVSADIDFQKVKERRETFNPDSKVAVTERVDTTKSTNAGRGGVTGAASNVARAGASLGGGGAGGGGNSSQETISTDYIVPRSVLESEHRGGVVKRLTIAAIVDPSAAASDGGAAIPEAVIQNLVEQATGFQSGRDKITVTTGKLTVPVPEPPDEEAARLRRMQAYVALARNISLALAVVLAASVVPMMFLRRRPRPEPAPTTEPTPAPAPAPDAERRANLDRLIELARTDPDRVASVFGLMVGRS